MDESTTRVDSSVPLTHHDPRDLGLICHDKETIIRFRISSDSRIQSWIFLKKHTLTFPASRGSFPGPGIELALIHSSISLRESSSHCRNENERNESFSCV